MLNGDACYGMLGLALCMLDKRNSYIERFLGIPLTEQDEDAIRIACRLNDVRIGRFYYWYLIKYLLARRIGKIDKHATMDLIFASDRSDYGVLDEVLIDTRGMIIAIPHHGQYILSMVAIAERIGRSREVLVFYGNPKNNPGNELFDALYARIWSEVGVRVNIVHDTRPGMAKAMRSLLRGAVVLIMPDVYKDEKDTYHLSFLGRVSSVMLGTATLARKTNSRILPVVSIPTYPGYRFKNIFGDLIEPWCTDATVPEYAKFDDYRTTAAMFESFEKNMSNDIYHWQFIRQHYQREGNLPMLTPELLSELIDLALMGSKIAIDKAPVVLLDH